MKITNISTRLRWIGVAILFAFFQTVSAQQTLTLKEAIDFALKNKAEALKAKNEIKRGDLQIKEAKSGALPQISCNTMQLFRSLHYK